MAGPIFDDHAAGYDAWYATPMGGLVDRLEKEAVFRLLEPRRGQTILDVGCGTGNYALELAARGLAVTGVDVSPAMLELAREKARARSVAVSFHAANALKLPFADHSFEAVLSVTALEFVAEPAAALIEAYRVLKPGGRLVVGVIGRESAWGCYYAERARTRPDSVFRQAHLYTALELGQVMPGRDVVVRAALFVPPDFDFSRRAEALELERDALSAGRGDGGFLCALAVKGAAV
ncbi:MAG: methyltransferase domain-containing protein [Peptococcaceae bacterium]|nr:methyltransferase domain-containing protein [Peptococcaceae bacterium]